MLNYFYVLLLCGNFVPQHEINGFYIIVEFFVHYKPRYVVHLIQKKNITKSHNVGKTISQTIRIRTRSSICREKSFINLFYEN